MKWLYLIIRLFCKHQWEFLKEEDFWKTTHHYLGKYHAVYLRLTHKCAKCNKISNLEISKP